jgi:hypothetical protein
VTLPAFPSAWCMLVRCRDGMRVWMTMHLNQAPTWPTRTCRPLQRACHVCRVDDAQPAARNTWGPVATAWGERPSDGRCAQIMAVRLDLVVPRMPGVAVDPSRAPGPPAACTSPCTSRVHAVLPRARRALWSVGPWRGGAHVASLLSDCNLCMRMRSGRDERMYMAETGVCTCGRVAVWRLVAPRTGTRRISSGGGGCIHTNQVDFMVHKVYIERSR